MTLFSSAYKGHFFNVSVYQTGIKFLINPLHPNISLHILYTVLYTFPKVLTRRICFDNYEILYLMIICFIPVTLVCESQVML